MKHLSSLALVAVAVATGVSGCAEHLDTTRVVPARATLGAEVYKVLCQRVATSELPEDVSGRATRALCAGDADPEDWTPPRLRALAENRTRLVAALDQILPAELEDDLRDFLLELLPLYDAPRDRLPRQTRATADLLSKLVDDPQVLAALARLSTRQGYRPLRIALGVARPVLAYPQFDDFAGTTLRTIDTGGAAATEWDAVLRALALELATAQTRAPLLPGEETTLRVARGLLFRQDDAFASGTAHMVVMRDARGLAMPDPMTGVVSPFVDGDGDGLADVDALGRYVVAGGLPLPAPFATLREASVARDSRGRALRPDATYYYGYFDADRTLLAGLAREARPWLDPSAPTALDLAFGLPALLGPRASQTEIIGGAHLTYEGFDTAHGPLFDLVYAVQALLNRPETDDALAATDRLMRNEEGAVAGLIDAALDADHRADLHPEAVAEQPNVFWDDMVDVGAKVARTPGLTEALLRGLADPRSRHLGTVYGRFLRNRDHIRLNSSDVNGPVEGDFVTRVDRSRPDVIGNQSLFERSLALIHDLDGVRVCNKEGAYMSLGGVHVWPIGGTYRECEMFEIPNAARFYAEAVVGRAELVFKPAGLRGLLELGSTLGLDTDALLADLTGIDGMTTHPTARAVARFTFAPHNEFLANVVDPVRTRDGVDAVTRHGDTIFAWEKEIVVGGERVTFTSVMAPTLDAFLSHGPSDGEFLFGTLTTAMHRHWASRASDFTQRADPRAPNFSYQDNLRSYEELVAEDFDEAGLIERLNDLGLAMDRNEIRPGTDVTDAVTALTELMLDGSRSGALRFRDGRTRSCRNDGLCRDGVSLPAVAVSPMDLMLDALSGMDRALDAEPARRDRWRGARSRIVDQMLTTRRAAGSYELADRRVHGALLALVPFLRERIAAHRTAGDLDTWASTLSTRAENSLGSAVSAALIDFIDAVQNDSEARNELSRLAQYLTDEGTSSQAFDATIVALADLLQVLEDERTIGPLLQGLSSGIAPNARDVAARGGTLELDGSALDETLLLLRSIRDVDTRHVMRQVMSRLVAPPPSGSQETPIETVIDVIAEVNRASPGAGGSMSADDFSSTLGRTRDFMSDRDHGMERLYDVVNCRDVAHCQELAR